MNSAIYIYQKPTPIVVKRGTKVNGSHHGDNPLLRPPTGIQITTKPLPGMYVCMIITYSRVWINRVRLPILLVVSWTGKMNIPLSPCVPENLVSRDGFSRPVPRQPAHLHTQAESGAYLRDSSRVPRWHPLWNRHTPSGQSRVYRVTQLRTDGVHCREFTGTGPVNLKAVPNGCCLGRSPWTN